MELEHVPSSLTAGESLALRLSRSACPASGGWTLRLVVKDGPALVTDAPGVAEGDAHKISLTDTSGWPVRELQWQLWGSKASAGISMILNVGRLLVRAGITGDGRTHEERVLADLQAALERLAGGEEAEVVIFDRRVVYRDPKKVEEMIGVYQTKVALQRGINPLKRIQVGG